MRWRRALASWIGILALAAGGTALTVVLLAGSLEDAARVVGLVTACVGLLGVGTKAIRHLVALRHPGAVVAMTDQELDGLALAVRAQWEAEAARRLLLAPAPLPLQWRPLTAEVGDPRVPGRFSPVPGLTPHTHATLERGGGISELFNLSVTWPSGRVVLVGPPGSGKSAAAVLLLLETLRYRATLEPAASVKVPVPVLVTLADWTPADTPFDAWFAARLATFASQRPLARAAGHGAGPFRSGVGASRRAGRDAPDSRPVALEALAAAPVRVLVLTRTAEHAEASRRHRLLDAVVAELTPLEPATVVGYLGRSFPGAAPAGWSRFTECLADDADGELALALAHPLTVALVRDTYAADDDMTGLVTAAAGPDGRAAVTNMLLDRLIDVRYAARPGQPSAPETPARARAALGWIAMRMNEEGTRDLAWWRVDRWASPWPYRILAATAVVTWFALNWLVASAAGADVGVVALIIGPPVAVSVVVLVLVRRRDRGDIHVLPRISWRSVIRPTAVSALSAAVLGMLLEFTLTLGLFGGDLGEADPQRQALAMLAFGTVFGVGAVPIGVAWVLSHAHGTRPLTPTSAWRESRKESRVVALLLALGVWLPFGLAWLVMGVLGGTGWLGVYMLGGLVLIGLELALTIGVIRSPTTRATVAACQLAARHHAPLRLMRFLEDAHARGVLRTVGPVYQFRHAGLQDRLAVSPHEQSSSAGGVRQASSSAR